MDVPPTSLPLASLISCPSVVFARSVFQYRQSNSGIPATFQLCSPLTAKRGRILCSSGKSGPASKRSTLHDGSSDNRAETTPPLEPAPMTITSKSSIILFGLEFENLCQKFSIWFFFFVHFHKWFHYFRPFFVCLSIPKSFKGIIISHLCKKE